jgi:hypothetical protein
MAMEGVAAEPLIGVTGLGDAAAELQTVLRTELGAATLGGHLISWIARASNGAGRAGTNRCGDISRNRSDACNVNGKEQVSSELCSGAGARCRDSAGFESTNTTADVAGGGHCSEAGGEANEESRLKGDHFGRGKG